jgi:hypothetical protein
MRARALGSLLLAITAACCARPLAASSWDLVSCDPSGEPRWRDFENAVRKAKPSSTLYVPKPYPTTDQDVVADYLFQFMALHQKAQDPKNLPPHEDQALRAIRSGKVSYQVMRIENWTGMRCGWNHKRDFYHLVRAFEGGGGIEITRALIADSGHLVTWMNLPASVPGPVEPSARVLTAATAAAERINREFGIEGVDPEYVTTYGTIDCDFVFPCLAFHEHGLSYVVYRHELFEVSPKGPKLMGGKDVGTVAANAKLLPTLSADERLISLGGRAWTVARKASAAQIRHGISNFR